VRDELTFHRAGVASSYAEQHYRIRPDSAAELMRKRAAEEAARKEALDVVERWNRALAAGPSTGSGGALWSPTIRCAIVAGTPWLDVYCPGCRTSRAIDIRTLDRHPLASVGGLVLGLRCTWCQGDAPMPVLTLLLPFPPLPQEQACNRGCGHGVKSIALCEPRRLAFKVNCKAPGRIIIGSYDIHGLGACFFPAAVGAEAGRQQVRDFHQLIGAAVAEAERRFDR
jgi:hypothetical protein